MATPEVTVKRTEPGAGAEARIKELTAELRTLKAELATAQEAAKGADGYKAKLDEVKTAFKTAEASWADEKAMLGAGLKDAEAHTVARALYGALPEADRPATLGEWVTGWTPETRPKAVAPYFADATAAPAVVTPAATLADQVAAGIRPANPAPPKAAVQPPSPSALTREKFGQLAAEAARTGNYEGYNAAKPEAVKLGYI